MINKIWNLVFKGTRVAQPRKVEQTFDEWAGTYFKEIPEVNPYMAKNCFEVAILHAAKLIEETDNLSVPEDCSEMLRRYVK